jgi:Holliday junction resolvase RusA-like endonuclease
MAAGLKLEPKKHYALEIELYLSSFRRDRDNQVKLIQDGLMRMGADWDDSQVHNLLVHTISVRDASEEKAVVTVEIIPDDIQKRA